MAAEDSNNAQPQAPPPTLPPYPEVILAAIEALDDKNGSNKSAITKHIEATYGQLPAAHSTLLSHHLNRLKQGGQLVMVKNNYMKPDPNAPRVVAAAARQAQGAAPTWYRAGAAEAQRPTAEAQGPLAPLAPPKKKAPSPGSGRPRGRPPKMAKTTATESVGTAPAGGAPRGRGRPPKVKPPVAATVGC